jgi:hypothetical protein
MFSSFRSLIAPVVYLVALAQTETLFAVAFWISPTGNDLTNTGASNSPWATIGKARDHIRTNNLNTNMAADIVVNITPGTYVIGSAVNFGPADSASNGYSIVYRAANGPGTVNLVGSADVNGWSQHSGNIWKINVGVGKPVGTIYENGVRGRLARSPNHIPHDRYPQAQAPYKLSAGAYGGYDAASNRDWLEYAPGDFSSFTVTSATQVTWWGFGGYRDWGMWSPALLQLDTSARRLYLTRSHVDSPPAVYPAGTPPGADRYFVKGVLSFLDAPGEFYYSTTDGWLYYSSRAGGDPSAQDMRVPLSSSQTLISVQGSAPGTHAHHLKFDGLTLAYSNYGTANQGTLALRSTDHIEVLNCHFHNVGNSAIYMYSDNDHNLVYGCWIEHCGVGGIWVINSLNRTQYPNNKSEFNVISNCKIHDLGEVLVFATLTAGVLLFDTNDCEVSYCDISNSARYAISLRGHWSTQNKPGQEDNGFHFSRNNTFKYLRLTDCMTDSGDGAIMHAAHCNGSGDPLGHDNINYWQQILISGAYADISMEDWAPNGIFFDHPDSCLYQNLSNIQIDWVQAQNDIHHPTNTGPYRGNVNPIESQTTYNLSWLSGFNESLMQYAQIGLKADFPGAYDDRQTVTSEDHTLDYVEAGTGWGETTIGGLFKGDGRYHTSGTSSQFARWTPTFPFTRNYQVSIWKMGNSALASSTAPYLISHRNGTQWVSVNQQTGAAGWVNVGIFPFSAGRNVAQGAVELSADTSDDLAVRADAVRFTVDDDSFGGGERGWWEFDNGSMADSSGFGHAGNPVGVGSSQLHATGPNSAYFGGVSSYVYMTDHPDLDIGTGDFAISLWFYREANSATNLRILSKGAENNTDKGYAIYGSDTFVTFALSNGTSRQFLNGTHLGVGKWNHLAVNISRTGYMTLYVNGTKAAAVNITDWNGLDLGSTRNLNVGRSVTSGTLYWPGRVDDLALFQRLLSDEEIEGLSTPAADMVPPP